MCRWTDALSGFSHKSNLLLRFAALSLAWRAHRAILCLVQRSIAVILFPNTAKVNLKCMSSAGVPVHQYRTPGPPLQLQPVTPPEAVFNHFIHKSDHGNGL